MRPFLALALVLVGFAVVAQSATPTDENPRTLFPVRTDRENEQLLLQAAKLYQSVWSDVKLFRDRDNSNSLNRLKPLKISEAYVNVSRLRRLAMELVLRGETAGVDLERRADDMRRAINETVGKYMNLPGKKRQFLLSYSTAQRESRNRTRRLPRIEQLANDEKWEQAYEEIYEIVDFINSRAVWYDQKKSLVLILPFQPLRNSITREYLELRKQQGAEALATLRREADPHLAEFVEAIEAFVAGKQSAAIPAGADGLNSFLDRWRKTQLEAIRCHGIDWARMGKLGRTVPPELAELTKQWEEFSENVRPAILSWIRSEVDRTDPSEARDYYLELLPILAEIAIEQDNDIFLAALSDPLAKLAAKDEELHEEVVAYRVATSDMLRWRRRRSSAIVSLQNSEVETLDEVFLSGAMKTDNAPGILQLNVRNTGDAKLLAPAPATVEGLAANLIGKRVRVGKLAGLPISRPMATTQYGNRCFGTIVLPPEVGQRWEALRNDLISTDASPPLTLEAAVALERARRGDFQQGECEIVHVALESLTSRLVTLKKSTQRIFSLSRLPDDRVIGSALDQVLVRFELRPIWLQQESYFLPLESATDEEPTP